MKRRSRHNLLIAVATAMGAQLVCNTAAQEPCKLAAIGTTIVAAVRDGRTLLLANGRELRLGGIEVTDDSRATLQPWSPEVRCDSNGSGLATTATAAWSHLLFRALLREALQQTVFEHIDACGRNARRGLTSVDYGPIQISPLCRRRILPSYEPNAADSRLWEARSCRYARAGPLYM